MSSSTLILLVEDDRDIRDSLAEILEDEGYRVAIAGDGEVALEYLASGEAPALILLDMWMPRLDAKGFRAVQLQDPAWAKIPTVLMTGGHDAVQTARELAVMASVRKPVTIDALLQVIRDCLP